MHRDATARSRIREYLRSHGPVEDASGHASGVLREAVVYQGSAVAFIQMLASMDRDGEVERTIKGKRTFRIAGLAPARHEGEPGHSPSAPSATGQLSVEIDYERLARAVVDELAGRLTGVLGAGSPAAGFRPAPSQFARDERARLQDERDEYAARLAEARSQIDELLTSSASPDGAGPHSSAEPGPLFRKPADSTS